MTVTALTPIQGNYSIPKGMIFFKPTGQNFFEDLGDVNGFNLTVETERAERYANNLGARTLVDSAVTQVRSRVEFELVQMTDRNRAIAAMSDLAYLAQSAAATQSKTFTAAAAAGNILDVGFLDLTNVTVTDGNGTPVSYTLGTHYELDAQAGLIRIIAVPGSADTAVKVNYDVPAITSAAKRLNAGIGQNTDIRGAMLVRGVNDVGVRTLLRLHSVRLSPSGSRGYVADNDYATLPIAGDCFADLTEPAGFRLGWERDLP